MKLFEFFSILFFSGSVLGQDFLFSDEIEENKNDRSRTSVLRSNPRRISQLSNVQGCIIKPECQSYHIILECDEFKELTEEVNIFGSFSLIDDDKQADVTSTCSSTAGLVVGGEDAKPNEFPHMVSFLFENVNGFCDPFWIYCRPPLAIVREKTKLLSTAVAV